MSPASAPNNAGGAGFRPATHNGRPWGGQSRPCALGGRADQTACVRSNSRSLAMRSSVGGWVENSLAKFTWRPVRGLMM